MSSYNKNIIYVKDLNSVGGTETFIYELCKKYPQLDLEIIYETSDNNQLERLSRVAKCSKYNGNIIDCDVAAFNYNLDIIDNINAKKYVQIIHFDYLAYDGWYPPLSDKIDKYYSVSKISAENFTKLTGKPCEYLYLPTSINDEEDKTLFLLSAQRNYPTKGIDRIKYLIEKLDESKRPYVWYMFMDKEFETSSPNVVFMKPRINIQDFIRKADYVVVLSDAESWCYTAYESLILKTPVIATKIPVFMNELGLNESNSILLDFDMNNLNIDQLYSKKGQFKFNYEPKNSNWEDIFN